MGKSYRDLIAWQKAIELVVAIYAATGQFPKEELYGLTSQIRRASSSIGLSSREPQFAEAVAPQTNWNFIQPVQNDAELWSGIGRISYHTYGTADPYRGYMKDFAASLGIGTAQTEMANPTFDDLYWSDAWSRGNPDLEPERSWSYELSANYGEYDEKKNTVGFFDRQKFSLAMDAGRKQLLEEDRDHVRMSPEIVTSNYHSQSGPRTEPKPFSRRAPRITRTDGCWPSCSSS